jgi:hypothetical protein
MKKSLLHFDPIVKFNRPIVLFSLVLLIFALASCHKRIPEPVEVNQTLRGPEVTMGNGKANSFFKLDNNGTPLEIGFEMTMEALTGLTQDQTDFAKSVIVLPLDQKALDVTPFDHLVINWQPHGHPPMIFADPHFDFHLYTITLEEQRAIPPYTAAAAKFDSLPPAGFIPASYKPDNAGIPAMGKHWADPAALSSSFSHIMIYGSYNGQVNFVEPMLTLAVLQAGTTINTTYAQPLNFAKAGKWYPTKYNIYKDQQTLKHIVSLSEFVKR